MIFAQAAVASNVATVKIVNVVPTAFADLPSDANAPRRETPSLYNENAPLKTDAQLATAQKTPFSRKNALSFGVRASPTRFADAKSPDYNDFNALSQPRFGDKIVSFFAETTPLPRFFPFFAPFEPSKFAPRPCFLGRPPYNIRNIPATAAFSPENCFLLFFDGAQLDANRPLFLPFPF